MASIIIDEIVPTKWRLRLRDGDGKTREVVYRAGTPLELDAASEAADGPGEAAPKDTRPKGRREKPHEGPAEKPRASDKPKSEATAHAKKVEKSEMAEKAEKKKDDATEKQASTPKPQVRRRKHEAGPGPGGLAWEETDDDGVTGLRASFGRGAFKLLHAGGETYGLFFEWNSGKYQTLSCGSLGALKQEAARWTEEGMLHAPRTNLGAEAAKVACAAKGVTPTKPQAESPPPPSPPVDPEKDKVLMQGFEATVEKLIAARKGTP